MKKNRSLRYRFRVVMILLVVATLIITALLMAKEMWSITLHVSKDYARLYTNEFVGDFQALISREIALSLKASRSSALLRWLANESNPVLKRLAFREIEELNDIYKDKNFFIAFDRSKHIYFVDPGDSWDSTPPDGTLNVKEPKDIWFFKTLEAYDPYLLNIDLDRFINSMRVWINVKAIDPNTKRTIGILGTGLKLDELITAIFEEHERHGAKTIVVNEFGAIQMDSDLDNIYENNFGISSDPAKTLYQYSKDPEFIAAVDQYFALPETTTVIPLKDSPYQFAALAPIKDTNWHVVTLFSMSALYRPTNFLPLIAIAISATFILAFIVNLFVSRQFVQPFEKLKASIDKRDLFQDQEIFGIDREDEFGELAQTIQLMTERLMHSVSVGMFILSREGRFLYVNPYFLDQFKCEDLETFVAFSGNRPRQALKNPEDCNWLDQILIEAKDQYALELELINALEEPFWVDVRLTKVVSGPDNWQYEGILINIQGVKENVQNLTQLAAHDPLTGLFNRNYLETFLLENAFTADSQRPLSLILFDLDFFKKVNDTWGHDIGDSVLIETARIAKACIRQSDALIRWGGEEFAILMPDTEASGSRVAAEKIRSQLNNFSHPVSGVTTASFGVATRLRYEPFSEWFKRADLALYRAKQSGRNLVFVAEDAKGLTLLKLQWSSTLNSGIQEIDTQHQALFQHSEALIQLARDPSNSLSIQDNFRLLLQMIKDHFETEIQVLSETSIPQEALATHHQCHLKLLAQLDDWQAKFDDPNTKGFDVLAIFIQAFIVDHLLEEDIKLFRYLPTRPGLDGPSLK